MVNIKDKNGVGWGIRHYLHYVAKIFTTKFTPHVVKIIQSSPK